MIGDRFNMKEIKLKNLLESSDNWEYLEEAKDVYVAGGPMYIRAKCNRCGHVMTTTRGKFFRRRCDIPCPVCTQKAIDEILSGMIIDKYEILYCDNNSWPLKCVIKCTKCDRILYDIKIGDLLYKPVAEKLCECRKFPKDKDVISFRIKK